MMNRSESRSHRVVPGLAGVLILGLASGCYGGLTGFSGASGNGGADAADEAEDGPGAADDEGDEAPGDPSDPAAGETPFHVPNEEARLLPFPVRMQNLADLTGQPIDHPMFLELFELRFQLGDHDFASGVAPDLRWSAERMQYWVRGLKPVCESEVIAEAYPDLRTNPRPFMQQAWGHEPTAEDVDAVLGLADSSLSDEQKTVLTCVAVLTALDFVSI